jgi:hypothetical protein
LLFWVDRVAILVIFPLTLSVNSLAVWVNLSHPMKQLSKFCALVASTMMLTVSAEAAFTVINGYAITTNTYATNSNWLTAVQTEFGASATVGTFEGLKAVFDADTSGLATLLGGGTGMVTYNGNQASDGGARGYFLQFFGGAAPSNWTVHDTIGSTANNSQLSLGSWYDDNRIIAYVGTAVPEPSSVLVAGLLGLGALGRRRRN